MKKSFSLVVSLLVVVALLGLATLSLGHGLRSLNAYCSDSGSTTDSSVRHIAISLPSVASHPVSSHPTWADDEDDEWWSDFLCDIRVTDVALAIIAFLLAVIGLWQGLQLRRAASAARDAALAAKDSAAAVRELVERVNRSN